MSEYQDPYGPAALYADIQHDKIQVEPDLKEEILGAFERVGTFRDKRGYFWRSEDPRVVLDELIAAVQQNLDTKHDQRYQASLRQALSSEESPEKHS